MAIFIKVYKKNNKIVIDNGVKRNEYTAPANVSYSAVNVPGLRSPDRVTLKAFGLPVVTDKAVDVFCDEAGNQISVNLVLAELLAYFDSLGIAQNSGGGGTVDQEVTDSPNAVSGHAVIAYVADQPSGGGITQDQADARYVQTAKVSQSIIQGDTDPVAGGAVQSALAQKVNVNGNKQLSDNNYTDGDRAKVQSFVEHNRGNYPSYSALAQVVGIAGDTATVDVTGQPAQFYIWDATDNTWVASGSTGSGGAVSSVNGKVGAVSLVQDDITPGTLYTQFPKTSETKLAGIATGATANSTDAQLRDRATHTGVQPANSITEDATHRFTNDTTVARLAGTSGNNTGDETATTIINKIGNGSTINSQYLPAYVDDVLEGTYVSATVFNNEQGSPYTLAKGVIYVDTTSNFEYRYSGTTLVKLVASPGTTDDVPEGTTNKYFTDARALSATAAAIASAAGFQAETVTYQARVNATAGASISAADLLALDAFVLTGKNAGWWQAVKFFAPMMGNNLAAALVKFVVDASGIPSLGNVNFVEADYTQQFGFNVTTNTTKGLTTGFIPSNNNITPNSIGALVCTPLKTTAAGGGSYLVADSYSDANGKVPLLTFNGLWSSGASWIIPSNNTASSLLSLSPGGVKTQNLASVNGTVGNSYTNGISANTLTVGTSTAILNTEISLFRNLFGGTFRYTPGSLGGLMFTTGLTVAQNESLAKAYYVLNRTIRRAHYETPLNGWFGDSITGWIGSPTLGYPAIAGSALSTFELNFGTPSSKVVGVNTFNAATPYLTRYLEIIRNGYGMSTLGIMGGTNDMLVDPATNGTTATISAYQAGLLTIYNAFKPIVPKVIAVGIPYNSNVNVTKMNAYNAANVAAVVSANLVYVDSFNIYLDSNNTASELLPDGTHPSLIYATLIGEHTAAAVMGKIYRDVKIPATLVTANSTVAFPVTMIGLRKSYVMQLGESQVTNTGISFTAAYSSDNNATINIKNNTGADITTVLTNIRLLFFLNF